VRQIFALALADLEAECAAAGKAVHCAVFRAYDVDADETTGRPTYDALAQQHGVPVTQVTNYLSWARRRFRARVLDRLRELRPLMRSIARMCATARPRPADGIAALSGLSDPAVARGSSANRSSSIRATLGAPWAGRMGAVYRVHELDRRWRSS
jgi:hypothetical protein